VGFALKLANNTDVKLPKKFHIHQERSAQVVFLIVSSVKLKTGFKSYDIESVIDNRIEKSFTNMNNWLKWRLISQSNIIFKNTKFEVKVLTISVE
jgi:hypothetical protein